jgi:hypothetical protein
MVQATSGMELVLEMEEAPEMELAPEMAGDLP